MTIPLHETEGGTMVSIVLSLVSMAILSVCLSRRVQNVRDWSQLPLVCWLVILIYIDSIIFVLGTAILSNGFGVDFSQDICSKAILLCLGCYLTTKFLYYFLVERVYVIRRSSNPRRKDWLYLFNTIGMLIPYCIVIVLNFYFRFAIYENHTCRIGMKRVAMGPLIGFDILVNVYLTSLFLIPLRGLYSYRTSRTSHVRVIALRTFIGSCCTLVSSVVNLTVLLAMKGEPGWICLMCCNIDILFSVLVLHWITSKDNASTFPSSQNAAVYNTSRDRENPAPARFSKRKTAYSPRLAQEDLGLSEYTKRGGVTTLVTATRDTDEDELARVPNVITVESEHVVEVEQGRISISDHEIGAHMGGKISSTEKLFQKN